MASSYRVIAQSRDVIVLSPTTVHDAQRVTIQTAPTGVIVEYPLPIEIWQDDHGAGILGSLAEGIENLMAQSAAVAGTYGQDVDDAGLLVDYLDVVIEYVPTEPGRLRMTTIVRIPLEAFLAGADPWFTSLAASPQSLVAAAYDELVATANL